jgi:hypothetical protein
MKKFSYLFVLLALSLSCSSDDSSEISDSDLVGTWEKTLFIDYFDNDEDSPYENVSEPEETILIITNSSITTKSDERTLDYNYNPEEGKLTFSGSEINVEFETIDRMIFINYNDNGKSETYFKRLE